MSSVILPENVAKFKGRWEQRCGEICRILLNYVDGINGIRGKVKYGVYFMANIETPEDEALREKQELRHQEEEKANGGEGEGNGEKYEEITLTLVLNKVCGGKYNHPNEFWAQLGQMFK
mmetsp:Transcript_34107/g.33664  ORF Transcript_34107/g.33664 Transcript_34107/m.33664 type:complete len:119 (+) Transcript_34107:464-820(+)